MSIAIAAIMVVAGYLSGSVSYATLITRGLSGKDIREMGNRNPGTLNVGKNLGKGWGVLVALLDALKSFLPMLVASVLLQQEEGWLVHLVVVAVGMAAIVGHWRPVFHGFRGGQAVGCAIGVFLFVVPLEFVISFAIASLFGLLVMRRRDPAWVRWVPISLMVFVPVIATGLNVVFGRHPWEWMAGLWVVSFLVLGINFQYLRKRVGGAVAGPGRHPRG